MQTYLKTKPVWIQLLIFLGMGFALFFIILTLGGYLLSRITGISLLQDPAKFDSTNPNAILHIRGLLLLQFLSLFLAPTLLFSYFSDPKPMEYLGFKRPHKNLYWILAIILMFTAIPTVEYLGVLNQKLSFGNDTEKWMKSMEEQAGKQIQFMLNRHTISELIMNLIFISLFAAIGEELFFRGVLQRLFIRAFKDPWAGIVMTAAIFSAFHLQFYGFFPRLFLGIILGAIYWYSGSLWTAILAHFCYDGFIIVLVYLNPKMIENTNQPMINSTAIGFYAVIGTAITAFLLWQLKKQSNTSYAEVYKNDKRPADNPFTF
ncbi:MAG: CPBP family intramembrane glutamic endopeptidase [Flavisolibacter sp.]